ncbi:DUF5337 domain-containing protein [Jannaschia aquimarina]|uniref:DUF5337 domain-containing protein n=1 Tax=Jannaschia aquimarina TaxID=935700 RepID=A0A0D1EDR4_9RHOB|nr:DUF5337 domain-containing protein [Jannaschia aquimarina]KIT15814.1 hypothetical protein jaqu_23940 [Jannaschia aquimarina]SNT09234.1 hypothetical protein SAMN05421775_105209 [Jannaschia aquimarina]
MTDPAEIARKQRRIAAVILGAMALWIVALFLGQALGLPPRVAGLIDLAVLAVLGWAIFMALRLWRARKE